MKSFLLILLTALVCTAFAGCSKQEKDSSAEPKVTSVKELVDSIENKLLDKKTYFDDQLFQDNCEKLYGISTDKLADGGLLYSSNGSNADEISVLRTKDGTDCEELLKKRLDSRKQDFDSYRPEELPKLDKAQIFSKDGYSILIISDDAQAIRKTIEDKI